MQILPVLQISLYSWIQKEEAIFLSYQKKITQFFSNGLHTLIKKIKEIIERVFPSLLSKLDKTLQDFSFIHKNKINKALSLPDSLLEKRTSLHKKVKKPSKLLKYGRTFAISSIYFGSIVALLYLNSKYPKVFNQKKDFNIKRFITYSKREPYYLKPHYFKTPLSIQKNNDKWIEFLNNFLYDNSKNIAIAVCLTSVFFLILANYPSAFYDFHKHCKKENLWNRSVIQFFALIGADLKILDKNGKVPLEAALENENFKTASLFRKSCLFSFYGNSLKEKLIKNAIENGKEKTIEFLLSQDRFLVNKYLTTDLHTPLDFAIEKEQFKIAKILIKKGGYCNQFSSFVKSNPSKAKRIFVNCLEQGDLEIAEKLVSRNLSLKAPDLYFTFDKACKEGNLEMVKFFYSSGINSTFLDLFGKHGFACALLNGYFDICNFFILKKVGLHICYVECGKPVIDLIKEKEGPEETLLHRVCKEGNLKAVEFLIKNKTPSVKDAFKKTPIEYALEKKHFQIVEAFLDSQNVTLDEIIHHFFNACKNKDQAMFDFFLKKRVNVNRTDQQGNTLLHYASESGQISFIKSLLFAGADKTMKNQGKRPYDLFKTTCEIGNSEIIKLLQVDEAGNTTFHEACATGDIKTVRSLINKVDIHKMNKKGETPFYLALKNFHKPVIEFLLDQETKNQIIDTNRNRTYLHQSVIELGEMKKESTVNKKNMEKGIDVLLQNGWDVEKLDTYKKSALYYALVYNLPKIVEKLIKAGADVNRVDNSGGTYLHKLCWDNNLKAIQLLLKHIDKKNVDQQNSRTIFDGNKTTVENNDTSLHIAVCYRENHPDPKLIQILLGANADKTIRNAGGETPYEYWINIGKQKCLKTLCTKCKKIEKLLSPKK